MATALPGADVVEIFTTSLAPAASFSVVGLPAEVVAFAAAFFAFCSRDQIPLSRTPAVRDANRSAVGKNKHWQINRIGEGVLAEAAIRQVIDVATCV